ncbi:PTS transporter subunit EIIC [uncultured Traorella sp.]|uniref:PTS transporter subunit EIIC n=1 Tax=uncultured Traorella sp. TaxID=1929048 RepID=UPI0025D696A0|nr:PTS transporter subunit EIIC [uncultured Traorella sp.]
MSEKSLATRIIEGLGGVENVAAVENCMTRLRTVVRDGSKVNKEALTSIKEVLRVAGTDNEPQIVLGPGVADTVSNEIKNIPGIKFSVNAGEAVMTKKSATGIFQFFAKVFTPLIPVFAGAGLIFGIMNIFKAIWNLNPEMAIFNPDTSTFMLALNVLANTFFTYLNIAVAMSAAKVAGGNPYLGLVAGGIIINLGGLAGTTGLFGVSIVNGRGGTLAALLAGVLIAYIEKKVRKVVPDALKIHIPPLVSIVVVGLLTIYAIQPVAGVISDSVTNLFLWLIDVAGPLAYGIIAACFLPLVMTGMHHGLSPVHTTFIETLGYTPIYSCCSLAGGGQVGAALALLLKYKKEQNLKDACIGGLPAGILGIGEPLIYGVSLPLGRVFLLACAGAFVGGIVLGLFPGQGAVTINVSGVLGGLVNTNPLAYYLAYAVSVIAGFAFTFVVGAKESALDEFRD